MDNVFSDDNPMIPSFGDSSAIPDYSAAPIIGSEQVKRGHIRGQWQREGDEVVFLPTGLRRPLNYNERKFYAEYDRQEIRRQKRKEENEKKRIEAAKAREIVPSENAQDRLKRGHSQLTHSGEAGEEDKRVRLDGSVPYEMSPEEAAKAAHQADLMAKVAAICEEDEKEKEIRRKTDPIFCEMERLEKERLAKEEEMIQKEKEEKQKKKEADEAYWNNPEVLKMTGRIVATKKGVKMTHDDITRLSQLHMSTKRQKLRGQLEKQQNVGNHKIGLGVRGIRIHLVHDDGWAWWQELVDSFPQLEERDGGYGYRFLRPGEGLFRHFRVKVPDLDLLDDDAAPDLFKEEVLGGNTSLRDVEWSARKIGTELFGSRQLVVMKLSIPSEAVQAVLQEHGGQLKYGMELQRLTPFRTGRPRPDAGIRDGHPEVPEEPKLAGDRMDEEDGDEIDDDIDMDMDYDQPKGKDKAALADIKMI